MPTLPELSIVNLVTVPTAVELAILNLPASEASMPSVQLEMARVELAVKPMSELIWGRVLVPL